MTKLIRWTLLTPLFFLLFSSCGKDIPLATVEMVENFACRKSDIDYLMSMFKRYESWVGSNTARKDAFNLLLKLNYKMKNSCHRLEACGLERNIFYTPNSKKGYHLLIGPTRGMGILLAKNFKKKKYFSMIAEYQSIDQKLKCLMEHGGRVPQRNRLPAVDADFAGSRSR